MRRPPTSTLFPYTTLFRSLLSMSRFVPLTVKVRLATATLSVPKTKNVSCLPRPSGLGLNRSEEHTSELQSRRELVCRLLPEKKKPDNRATAPPDGVARRQH